MKNQIKQNLFLIAILIGLFFAPVVFASDSNGTVDSNYKYAWGNNLGWIDFACNDCNVHVTDTGLTGYAWSRQYGWINLSPNNGGVTNNCSGQLGGFAWSSSLGWIDFTGALIDTTGKFTGTVGSSTAASGQINFNCNNCNVVTDWKQCSLRSTPPSGGGGGSPIVTSCPAGTSGTYPNCVSIILQPLPTTDVSFADILASTPFGYAPYRADPFPDGRIDAMDFNVLMVHWGEKVGDPNSGMCGDKIFADINCDGTVDVLDFNLLMVYWGKPVSIKK